MRVKRGPDHGIGHMLDVELENALSLPSYGVAMDAAIGGTRSCWNLDGGSVTAKRQTGFILMLVQNLDFLGEVHLVTLWCLLTLN